MKLTTKLYEDMMGSASGDPSSGGLMALVELFARSHAEHMYVVREMYETYIATKKESIALFVARMAMTLIIVVGIGIYVYSMRDSRFFTIVLLGNLVFVAFLIFFGYRFAIAALEPRELVGARYKQGLRRLEEFMGVLNEIRFTTELSALVYTRVTMSDHKEFAEEKARALAKELHEAEDVLGEQSERTDEIRMRVHHLLRVLANAGLIDKNWKGKYLARHAAGSP